MKINWYYIFGTIIGLMIIFIGCIKLSQFDSSIYISKVDMLYNLLIPILVIDLGLRWINIKRIVKE